MCKSFLLVIYMNKFSVFPEFVIFTKYLHELIKTEIILFQLYTKILQKTERKKQNKTTTCTSNV